MSSEAPTLYCANHPTVATTLRCNRCEKPICTKCAVLTPTGYRCTECVRSQQKVFDTALWYDYLLALVIAGVLSYIGSRLASYIGFFILFVAPIAGGIIAEAVRYAVRKRRSRALFLTAAAAALIGSLIPLIFMVAYGSIVLFPLIWQGVYTVIVTTTVYFRLSGIRV